MRFKNKIALVNGAETGIGKNVVKTLLEDGCRVVGTNFTKSNLIKNKNLEYYKKNSNFAIKDIEKLKKTLKIVKEVAGL